MEGKKVDSQPDCILEFELCKAFSCLPSQLAQEDNKKIEEFITIMNAISEHEKKGSRKQNRDQLKEKYGSKKRR